jgi:hypothetical protein
LIVDHLDQILNGKRCRGQGRPVVNDEGERCKGQGRPVMNDEGKRKGRYRRVMWSAGVRSPALIYKLHYRFILW